MTTNKHTTLILISIFSLLYFAPTTNSAPPSGQSYPYIIKDITREGDCLSRGDNTAAVNGVEYTCISRDSYINPNLSGSCNVGFDRQAIAGKPYCLPTAERIKQGEVVGLQCPAGSTAIYESKGVWGAITGTEAKATHCLDPRLRESCPKEPTDCKKCPVGSEVYVPPGSKTYAGCSVTPDQIMGAGGVFGTLGEITEEVKTYKVKYDIPCSPIFGGECPDIAGGEGATPGRYIIRLYQFGLMIVGLIAFGSISYGALKYILAAGSFTSIDEAKEHIRSAIYGIILLLGAATILGTIDTQFLNIINPGESDPALFKDLGSIPPPAITSPSKNTPKSDKCILENQEKRDGVCVCIAGYKKATGGARCVPV